MLTMLRWSFGKTAGLEYQDIRSKCLLSAGVCNEISELRCVSAAHSWNKCVCSPPDKAIDETKHLLQQVGLTWQVERESAWSCIQVPRSSAHLSLRLGTAHSGSVLNLDVLSPRGHDGNATVPHAAVKAT